MNIDFSWVSLKHIDSRVKLNKFCDSDKATAFCWWLETEVVDTGYVFREIKEIVCKPNLLNTAYRGDVVILVVGDNIVTLENPFTDESYTYDTDEFLIAFEEWGRTIDNKNK